MTESTSDRFEENIQIILRQTNYTYAEAREKLEDNNNDIITVIRMYLKQGVPTEKPATHTLSINQQIYKEIRSLMDEIEVGKQK